MSKLIVFNLGRGNLQNGFPFVSVRLESDKEKMQFTGSLPPATELVELYRRWQQFYNLLYKVRSVRKIQPQFQLIEDDDDELFIDENSVNYVSDRDFTETSEQLQNKLDRWLDSEDFRLIERQLRKQLAPSDEIRLIIQTEDPELRKLPWHIWQFFKDYTNAEVALSSLNFESRKISKNNSHQVRILAILGDSTGIDIQADRRLLERLPSAEIVFLIEPTRQTLDEQLWDKKGWDILFFAGHSTTNVEQRLGQIYINKSESLTIPQLKNALNKAIERGLQLAIFNSCEGLGLAEQLSDLYIPQVIVMREPVPDRVAQEFLKSFLTLFSEGQSFYLAVREARERLQGIEGDFPGASWLPAIFQNPAEVPLTWQQLRDKLPSPITVTRSPSTVKAKLPVVLVASLAVTTAIVGLRWFGILQNWELNAFDGLMQNLPAESADKRILIIGADEEDINRYGYPLSDETLAQLLNKLQQYRPAVIGLDIFRDRPTPTNNIKGHQALVGHFQKYQNSIAICAGSNLNDSTASPSPIPEQQIGFVDLYTDKNYTQGKDDTIRRYLLSRSPNPIATPSRCTTSYSFSWQLIYRYLKVKSIPVTIVEKNWKFGKVTVKRLETRSGGYQNLDTRGNQLLISYRNTPQIAQQVTVRDVLDESDRFNPAWVKDRVVLIGITAPSVPDIHDTPRGETRGINVHAHAVSQILSAVEDNRPLSWWLPQWGDILWIFGWSLIGGAIAWRCSTPLSQGLGSAIAIVIVVGISWFMLAKGGWMPLVPSILVLVFTPGSAIAYTLNELHSTRH
jgi:CHASE2 domain-containing sensor protein